MSEVIRLITGNRGKAEEYASMLNMEDFQIEICSIDLPEIQAENLKEAGIYKLNKAIAQVDSTRRFLMIDDVSLGFDAMGGFPGIYVKWFLKSVPPQKIHDLLSHSSTKAQAICLIGLHDFQTGNSRFFTGELSGEIVRASGETGFGWDSVFLPEGSDLTFGQMDSVTKNQKSHRALAVQKLREYLSSLPRS